MPRVAFTAPRERTVVAPQRRADAATRAGAARDRRRRQPEGHPLRVRQRRRRRRRRLPRRLRRGGAPPALAGRPDASTRASAPGRPLVRALFVTHLHADHIMDLANLFQGSWPPQTIDVYGPAPAGLPIPEFPPGAGRPLAFPDEPTPGHAGHGRAPAAGVRLQHQPPHRRRGPHQRRRVGPRPRDRRAPGRLRARHRPRRRRRRQLAGRRPRRRWSRW